MKERHEMKDNREKMILELQAVLESSSRRMEIAMRLLEDLKNSPPVEPERSNDLVRFKKQFVSDGTIYNYAAISVVDGSANHYWYITGAVYGKKRWTWKELLEFITPEFWHTIQLAEEFCEIPKKDC